MKESKKPYDLLIVFKDGTEKIIPEVSSHGFEDEVDTFFYHKKGSPSFLAMGNVQYFGKKENWVTGEAIPNTAEAKAEAYWKVWGGWRGNHDQRIEGSLCSNCGCEHPTVKGSLDLLLPQCPKCGSIMGVEVW